MKKIFSILFGSAFVVAGFTSCSNEEADIWNESSIERLEDTQDNYGSVFMSAENGWEMQYFPTAGSSGYTLALKFNDNGSVIAAMNNQWTDDRYTVSDPSTWKINIDNGPVLSFDSYNSVIHVFSDPKEIPGTSYSNGLGMEGDYEFIVITDLIENPDAEVITLKGKKRGTYAYLSRIPVGVNWEDHIDAIAALRNEFLVNNPSPLALTVNGKEYNMWYKKASDQLNIVAIDGDTISQEKLYHYTFNSKGLYLLEPFDLDDAADYQWFRTNQEDGQPWTAMTEMNAAESLNGAIIDGVTIAAGRPLWFFNQQLGMQYAGQPSVGKWVLTLDENNMDAASLAALKALDDVFISDAADPDGEFDGPFARTTYSIVGNYNADGTGGISLQVDVEIDSRTKGWMRFVLDRVQNENTVSLNFAGDYEFHANYVQGFENLISTNPEAFANVGALFANAEFNVEFDSHLTLRTVMLRNAQNPDNWYRLETTYVRL